MSLISILLVATSVLTVTVGLVSFFGVAAKERQINVWFLVTCCASAFWAISIAVFLGLTPETEHLAPGAIMGIYASACLTSPTALGFVSWRFRTGKILTVLSLALGVCLGIVVLLHPEWLYSSYAITNDGNSVALLKNWFNFLYIAYFTFVISCFCVMSFYSAKRAKNSRMRAGLTIFAVGMLIEAVCAGVFDLFLSMFVRYDLIWVGPLALSAAVLTFFYAALKYRIISVNSNWMKFLSYGVMLVVGAIVYMVIFYLIFTALFKIPNPSASVLVLNFLMIVIVLIMMPVINEIRSSIDSLISVGQVDIAYVIKKLNRLATKNVDLRDLASFLADHLHFAYIGFIINGRLYGSKALAMSPEEIAKITHLKQVASGAWQEPNKTVQKIFDEHGLKAVAELRNAKGKPFGQLIVGKPLGKASFARRDLIQLEMIINLVATVIDSEKHLRA